MTIASLTDAHYALKISATDTSNDTEITYALGQAEGILTNFLKRFGFSGTLPNTDTSLIMAEAYFAAAIFREPRGPVGAAEQYVRIAERWAMMYVRGVLLYPVVPSVTPPESITSDQTTGGSGSDPSTT